MLFPASGLCLCCFLCRACSFSLLSSPPDQFLCIWYNSAQGPFPLGRILIVFPISWLTQRCPSEFLQFPVPVPIITLITWQPNYLFLCLYQVLDCDFLDEWNGILFILYPQCLAQGLAQSTHPINA